jgi:transposase
MVCAFLVAEPPGNLVAPQLTAYGNNSKETVMAKRKRFTTDFKKEAVRMMINSDKAPAVIARELGVHRNQLYKWKEQLSNGVTRPSATARGRPSNGPDELTRLRQELERVKEERDVFKKAAAYFARELGV